MRIAAGCCVTARRRVRSIVTGLKSSTLRRQILSYCANCAAAGNVRCCAMSARDVYRRHDIAVAVRGVARNSVEHRRSSNAIMAVRVEAAASASVIWPEPSRGISALASAWRRLGGSISDDQRRGGGEACPSCRQAIAKCQFSLLRTMRAARMSRAYCIARC
jgi:hypothetical protein